MAHSSPTPRLAGSFRDSPLLVTHLSAMPTIGPTYRPTPTRTEPVLFLATFNLSWAGLTCGTPALPYANTLAVLRQRLGELGFTIDVLQPAVKNYPRTAVQALVYRVAAWKGTSLDRCGEVGVLLNRLLNPITPTSQPTQVGFPHQRQHPIPPLPQQYRYRVTLGSTYPLDLAVLSELTTHALAHEGIDCLAALSARPTTAMLEFNAPPHTQGLVTRAGVVHFTAARRQASVHIMALRLGIRFIHRGDCVLSVKQIPHQLLPNQSSPPRAFRMTPTTARSATAL